jgi:hypothetical protein
MSSPKISLKFFPKLFLRIKNTNNRYNIIEKTEYLRYLDKNIKYQRENFSNSNGIYFIEIGRLDQKL